MKFRTLSFILLLTKNAYASTTTDCNSCSPGSLKLVARNNTLAPVIMGNFQEDGCLVTVVACDIPECSDALLDSYRPDGTFKRVTNEDGTVWPHLEMKCSPDGEWIWDGEVQTEFSCYAKDCVIPSTTPASTQSSWSTTVNINGTETTVSPFSTESTTSFLTTTPEKCSLCLDVDTVMADENVKFEKPDGFTVIAEDNFIINYNVSCPGDKFTGAEGANVLSKLMCKYKNCEDYTSTTGITMGSSTSGTESTASEFTGSTTSVASTTSTACSSQCNDIESVMADANVRFARPQFIPIENDRSTSCTKFQVVCEPEEGLRCEEIGLFNGYTRVRHDSYRVEYDVYCYSTGWPYRYVHHERPFPGLENDYSWSDLFMCKFKNCEPYTPTPTSCSTCDITKLFNYEYPDIQFQPWYQDIATTDCSCKAHEISCELYNVDVCTSHDIYVKFDDDDGVKLASSETNIVKGNIYCNGNGRYQLNGK
ncbi:hypothetical protein CAEBREN_20928 [Caenorhabditis brenneri]|uniref:DUF281 domain-containing protein n=1 Tax=Caenorhabditis brenneri TaxID=135651 RepID=G0MCU2_CAEBE|nr:hypothetical protein CAEBREN_20928 [Caenorhabditis brenneri]